MTGATLDAGALIAFDRNDRLVVTVLRRAIEVGDQLSVPAGAVGQVWRDGRQQARLARLLNSATCEVVAMSDAVARTAGQLCGYAGTADVIDASVVLCARERDQRILTSDPDDLRRLDPSVELVKV